MEPYIGSVFPWPMNWAPRGFMLCEGQILPISQYTTLFAIIGTYYGGNGTTTFALPDMRGAVAVGAGQGIGLSDYVIGETGGIDSMSLIITELPLHTHPLTGITAPVTNPAVCTVPDINSGITASLVTSTGTTATTPGGNNVPGVAASLSAMPEDNNIYGAPDSSASMPVTVNITPNQALNITPTSNSVTGVLSPAGSSTPHNNMQPFTVVNYIIAYQGIFPSFD